MAAFALNQSEKGIYSLPAKELSPKAYRAVSSPLAATIIEEISREPNYPKAIAKKLKVHEQIVYYHIRQMHNAGFLKVIKNESIVGATACYYALVEPAFLLRFKPYESISKISIDKPNEFIAPFIENGSLNALIIVGSPDPHGPERARSRDGYYGMDLALYLGTFLSHVNLPHVKLDTEMTNDDLKNNNLILIGGPIVNKAVERINEKLPIYFDKTQRWAVFSKLSGETYPGDETGIVVRAKNPYNKEKNILVVAGKRQPGTKAAILSFLKYPNELAKGNLHNPKIFAKIIEGIDFDGDGEIDSIEVKE